MLKKLFALLTMLALTLSMAGCQGSTPAAPPSKESSEKTGQTAEYAVVLKVLSSQFWQTMKQGIEEEAKSLGITVDIYAAQTEDDVEGQVTLLENAISKGTYKAIGVAPISDVNLNNAIAEATKKGIYIVDIDEKINLSALKELGGTAYGYVATDNVAVGRDGAEYLIEEIGGKGEVAIVEGKAGALSGENRRNGAKSAFEAAGVSIVESQPADWDRTKAYDLATNYITAYPDLKAIYCCNDTMAMGVQEAVAASGKDIKVCGTDGNEDAIQSVQKGGLSATIAQDPAAVGKKGLQLMVEAVEKGGPIEITAEVPTYAISSILITKENASEYIAA